ncbi:MAG: DUF4340 domain-containing protein [Opitutae bacterium]|nr:DUF4340 domain-containing protein [Opitutae bacterium]
MRTKVTLVLVFLNVVLFYYIFHYEAKWKAERAQFEARRRVLGPEAAALDSFTRSGKSSPAVRAEKRGESWWLTRPYDWPANANAVSRILSELQLLEHETSFAVADLPKSGQTLADYGLADPAFTFAFTSAGKTYELKIGDDTKIGNRLYVLSPDGKRIHVVGRSIIDSVGLALDQLRSESIFTVPVFEVRSLGLQTAAPANLKVRLRREGARWAFETPILARANKGEVDNTVNALNALLAKKFYDPADPKLEKAGLDAPTLRITLEGNARRETLLLAAASPDGGYFAKIEDKSAVFNVAVPADLLERLRNAQETLRDKRILDFEAKAVTALTLVAPGQPEFSLQRLEGATGGGSWQLVTRSAAGQAPQTLPADSAVVQDLLQRLELFAAQKFLSDAPSAADLENYGFNRPERELTLNLNTGGGPRGTDASTLTLQIGIKPDERAAAYARVANAPFVYQVDPEVLEMTPVLARHFRQRLLRELPEGAHITGLKLSEIASSAIVFEAANPVALTPESLAQAKLTDKGRQILTTILAEMRRLRAQRFVADAFNPDHAESGGASQPWKYRLDVTLALTGGTGAATSSTSTLLLTDRLGGTTQLAGTAEFGGVTFEITQELLDALFAATYAEKHDPGAPAKPAAEPADKPKPAPEAPPAPPETPKS